MYWMNHTNLMSTAKEYCMILMHFKGYTKNCICTWIPPLQWLTLVFIDASMLPSVHSLIVFLQFRVAGWTFGAWLIAGKRTHKCVPVTVLPFYTVKLQTKGCLHLLLLALCYPKSDDMCLLVLAMWQCYFLYHEYLLSFRACKWS